MNKRQSDQLENECENDDDMVIKELNEFNLFDNDRLTMKGTKMILCVEKG